MYRQKHSRNKKTDRTTNADERTFDAAVAASFGHWRGGKVALKLEVWLTAQISQSKKGAQKDKVKHRGSARQSQYKNKTAHILPAAACVHWPTG